MILKGEDAFSTLNEYMINPDRSDTLFYEKEAKQKNSNKVGFFKSINNIPLSKKPIAEDIRVNYKNVNLIAYPVLQFQLNEEKIRTILRLCRKHNYDVSEEEARGYLIQMSMGWYPRIQNHNAIIRPWGNSFHIIQVRFSGTGVMGRTVEYGGADAEISYTDNNYNIPQQFTIETVITSEDIGGIRPRESLNSVMGESAYDQTGIQSSEFLHMVAHSLGGQDKPQNLMPGYHALNTAMIPIENFVHDLATMGIDVNYKVQMHPRVGNVIWVSGVTMTVGFFYNGNYHDRTWNIIIDSFEKLNYNYYNDIVYDIEYFKREIGLIN